MKTPGKLPPLPALRAFEAAARHGSISAAADELHVTHSAVSQQVKALESALGIRLFGRAGRGVVLTPAGQELAFGANEALGMIAQTIQRVRQRANPNRLTITTLPSFAACWLTPRIDGFLRARPEVEINIISTSELLDYARDGIDAGIRFGKAPLPELDYELLMRDEMLVVTSPDYLARKKIERPEDLASCQLLRSDGESWARWFACAGLDWPEPERGLFFDNFALALTWAENGHGVALTRRSLADDGLRRGRLVSILDVYLPEERCYWFVTPKQTEPSPLLVEFRRWLFAQQQSSPTNTR